MCQKNSHSVVGKSGCKKARRGSQSFRNLGQKKFQLSHSGPRRPRQVHGFDHVHGDAEAEHPLQWLPTVTAAHSAADCRSELLLILK